MSQVCLVLDQALGGELLHHVVVDCLGASCGIDFDDPVLALEHVDHRHAGLDKSGEPLLDALLVVVGSSAGQASVEKSLPHRSLGAVEEERELAGHDSFFELDRLVHLPGETVNEELAVAVLLDGSFHGVLQQLDCHFHGHNLAVFDVALDHLAELAARTLLLLAKQVAGRQVLEAIVAHKIGALRALAGTGTAEDEDDGSLVLACAGREERLRALGSREGRVVLNSGSHCDRYACLAAGECLVAGGVSGPVLLGLGGVVGDGLVAAGSADSVARLGDVVEAAAAEDEDEDERSDGELAVACTGAWDRWGAVVAGDLGLCRVLEEATDGGEGTGGGSCVEGSSEDGQTRSGVQDAGGHGSRRERCACC
jgi:hypothetical protein